MQVTLKHIAVMISNSAAGKHSHHNVFRCGCNGWSLLNCTQSKMLVKLVIGDWSERDARPRARLERARCASRSLQSLNSCGRQKKGTACSLGHFQTFELLRSNQLAQSYLDGKISCCRVSLAGMGDVLTSIEHRSLSSAVGNFLTTLSY